MRLYDGSGEYVPASEVKTGYRVECPDRKVREVLDTRREGQMVVFVFVDGFGFECPWTSRVLWKYAEEGR